eukprot:981440-Amphidinium_carterae.1
MREEDDELLLTDCSNLADAANKAFEELLAKKNNSRGDFNALFYMHEMKDGVERAAKRVECLSKDRRSDRNSLRILASSVTSPQ